MKLTAKIVVALVLGLGLVFVLFTRAQVEQATERFEQDMREDAKSVGRLLRPNITRTWRLEGRIPAMYLIQYTNETLKAANVETKLRVRWVWLSGDNNESARPQIALARLQATLEGQETTVFSHADRRVFTYVPVDAGIDGEPLGALEISESTAPLDEYRQRIRRESIRGVMILAGVCIVLILFVGTWLVGRPLRTLANAAERIGAGDTTVRVRLRQNDEVGTLATTLNATAARLEKARVQLEEQTSSRIKAVEQLRHADRLASVGTFAAGLAHELGTPLAVVSGRARLIADGTAKGKDVVVYAESIAKQSDKMAGIIRQLLDFVRRRSVTLSGKDLGELAAQTLELVRPIATKRGVELEFEQGGDAIDVAADGVQLQQVLTNLVMNAIDATADRGGHVTVEVGREHADPPATHPGSPGVYAVLRVRDQGRGIEPKHLARLFEPFFTTKPVGQGTGLGLAVSYGIAAEHGGWITVDSTVGHGATFSVYLPLGTTVA